MKKIERTLSIILLFIISLSNVSSPLAYAAENIASSAASPAPKQNNTPTAPPKFQQPNAATVLDSSSSLFEIGTQEGNQTSASQRVPVRMQQLSQRVYNANEDVTIAVSNPDNDPFTTSVSDAQGKPADVPITETNNGMTTNVQLQGSNEIRPGTYKVKVIDQDGNITSQDFSWGVLAMNTDKTEYHPNETSNISFGVLDNQGNMVCDARLTLQITNAALGINDILSSDNKRIQVNEQCQHHDFSLQPDYSAQYHFSKAGTYTFTLNANTSGGTHTITQTVPVLNTIPFDVQRVSATRIYPPNTYPMTFNITAHRDFSGIVTETVPQDFTITPATASASTVSYDNMQTVYLNANDPGVQLSQAIAASASAGGLVMPFQGNYSITQGFGAQMTDPTLQAFYTQYGLAGHDGVDFGVPMNTPLYAVDGGTITQAGSGDYGTTIIIQHTWGESYYGHLSTTAVKVGDQVTKGELVGYSGESGEATGPHLHFGMKPLHPDNGNGYYGKVDPLPYLPYNNAQSTMALSTLNPVLADATVLGSSTSADVDQSTPEVTATPAASVSAAVSPLPSPTIAVSPTATPVISQPVVSATPSAQPTPTGAPNFQIQTGSSSANENFSILDKQILTSEELANSNNTEKVKVITWHVTLKNGQSTTLGYNFQAPHVSPQFYLMGPMQFYQNGSNKVVFQEERQWQIASDDVGVEWYSNTTTNKFNGYSWQYRKKIDIDHTQVSGPGLGGNVTYDATGPSSSGQKSSSSTSLTWTHTVSGSNPAILVGVSIGVSPDGGHAASATDNGTPMSLIATVHTNNGNAGFLDVFGLLNAPTGANAIVVTATGGTPNEMTGGSESFDNVSSFGTAATAFGQSTTASVTTSGSTSGNIVAGFMAAGNTIASATAPSTSRFIATGNTSTGAGNSAGATSPSTGSNVQMQWTLTSDFWAAVAIEVKSSSGGGGTSLTTPTLDHSGTGFNAGTNTSVTWTQTIGSQSNMILIVGLQSFSTSQTATNGVTYTVGGVPHNLTLLTKVDDGTNQESELWYVVNPVAGAASLKAVFTANAFIVAGSATFYNVNTSNPVGTPQNAHGLASGASTASLNVPTSSNQMVFDSFSFQALGGGGAWTPAAGQTQLYIQGTNNGGAESYKVATGTTTNMKWTNTSSTDHWLELAVPINPLSTASGTSPAFMDSGGDATGDTTSELGFWSGGAGGTGTVAVDNTTSETGPDSLKITSGASGATAFVTTTNVPGDAGTRTSFYINFANLPTANLLFFNVVNGSGDVFDLEITSAGVLQLFTNGNQIGSNGATLSTNTWYRIDMSYTIATTTNYSVKVYVNGTQSISKSNSPTLFGTGTGTIDIGWGSPSVGNSKAFNLDDVYIDNDDDLSDTGDIHVTAKRPFSNGTTNQFNTSGSGSGYGSGHAAFVNSRGTLTGGFVQSNATPFANTIDEYTIESSSQGDVDISSDYPISEQTWGYMEGSGTCTNPSLINQAATTSTGTTLSTGAFAMFTSSIISNPSYPSGNTDVGISSCTNGTSTNFVKVEAAGMLIAYKTTDPNSLTNFPVLVSISGDTSLSAHAQSSAADILFTDSTGENLLPYEIESYSSGTLVAWVDISSLSADNDTIIYMYYGNPSAASLASTETWNSNFSGVYHLGPTIPSGSTLSVNDSTSNAANGTNSNVTFNSSGKVDGAGNFNGTTSVVTLPTTGSPATVLDDITVSAWVHLTTNKSFNDFMFSRWSTTSNNGWNLYSDSSGIPYFGVSTGTTQFNAAGTSNTLSTGTWYYLVGTYDGSTVNLYENGTLVGTNSVSNTVFTSPPNTVISGTGSTVSTNGILDEVRLSNTTYPSYWIQTDYTNQNTPASFYSLGGEETSIYAPTMAQVMRHGEWFSAEGSVQPFTF